MAQRKSIPCALSIAGSDSGGGAGIQADLKTFAALGVHGVSATTCLTAQNPKEVLAIQPVPATFLRSQLQAVTSFKPRAMKTGMLFSRSLIQTVIEYTEGNPEVTLVIDPVMIATSGAHLLKPSAVPALLRLMHLATVLTPNIPEAESLTSEKISDIEAQRSAARKLSQTFGCAVLLKGGHLKGKGDIADILHVEDSDYLLTAPRFTGVATHGTGCTLSAAITAGLAQGKSVIDSVATGKEFISGAIANSWKTGSHRVLNPFWQ